MAFTSFVSTYLAEMVCQLPTGQVAENTLYFESTVGTSIAQMDDLATVLETWWLAEVRPLVSTGVQLDFIRITDLTNSTAPSKEYLVGEFGTAEGNTLPGNVTAAISFKTALRGRSYRGRNYIIGMTEPQVENDSVQPTVVGGYEDAYEALALAIDGIDLVHVVASRTIDGVAMNPGVTTPISTYRMDDTTDSQRRRLRGRGA